MKVSLLISAVSVFVLAAAAPAFAHHSTAMFDNKKSVTVTGAVREFSYVNPHSWLVVVAETVDGKPAGPGVVWSFEMANPSSLLRQGIKKSAFMPGDKVTVSGSPMIDGRTAGNWTAATKQDGQVFRSPYGQTPPPAPPAPK